jgi:hypothetical protein
MALRAINRAIKPLFAILIWVALAFGIRHWIQKGHFEGLSQGAGQKAELLAEMIRVIFFEESEMDSRFYHSWLEALEQGASYEGTYRGLVYSARYRALEDQGKPATPVALNTFVEEMVIFQKELPNPTLFNSQSAIPQPVLSLEQFEASLDEPEHEVEFVRFGNGIQKNPERSKAELKQIFQQSSIYVLKRILGAEALKVIDHLEAQKEVDFSALHRWYSEWVVSILKEGIIFDPLLRNDKSVEFHYAWARSVKSDQLRWEVLSRLHQILNAKEKIL